MGKTILIVEDEQNIVDILSFNLSREGYDTLEAYDGPTGLQLALEQNPDLILLDLMLPGMDGWQVLREIRKTSNVPIIMLTAKDETFDKVLGLELGADDYVAKPFEPKELLARIKAVLRRFQPAEPDSRELSFPGLTISLSQYKVTYRDKPLEMPPKELELLYFLASHPRTVFTREQLLEQVWGYEYYVDSRTVDVHVKRLREKLEGSAELGWEIKTVWGVGYKFEVK